MNLEQIKSVSILKYLENKNCFPIKSYGTYSMYKSPFRKDNTASFKLDLKQNLWFDFGIGRGGSIIDLVMLLNNCSFIDAVNDISKFAPFETLNTTQKYTVSHNVDNNLPITKIIKVSELKNEALCKYIQERGISIEIAKQYCKELYYSNNNKTYFAIGFPNSNGGYEIRNNYFKGCIPPKAITHIKQQGAQRDTCYLFEGFMDFLSFLTIREQINPQYPRLDTRDYMVLNSITNLSKAEDLLTQYEKIHCFLDNDKAGKDAYKKLELKFKHKVQDASAKYSKYKDLNDYLCGNEWRKSIQKQSQVQSAKQIEPPRKKKGFRL